MVANCNWFHVVAVFHFSYRLCWSTSHERSIRMMSSSSRCRSFCALCEMSLNIFTWDFKNKPVQTCDICAIASSACVMISYQATVLPHESTAANKLKIHLSMRHIVESNGLEWMCSWHQVEPVVLRTTDACVITSATCCALPAFDGNRMRHRRSAAPSMRTTPETALRLMDFADLWTGHQNTMNRRNKQLIY